MELVWQYVALLGGISPNGSCFIGWKIMSRSSDMELKEAVNLYS